MDADEEDRETLLRTQRSVGLPAQQIFSIFFNQLYQGIQITLGYNIGVFVVRHFCKDETEEKIGELTGILASAFSTAQFCTSYFWGVMTDRIGRKPVVVIANFVMGMATLGLGVAPTFWLAVAARCLGGAANGSGVAIKTMLAESCDANTQARGMAYLNLGWGMGNIVGPVIGGFLSQPCDQYPRFPMCEPGRGLFAKQPFLPPCMVVGVLSLFACLNSACMLIETHPKFHKQALQTDNTPKEDQLAAVAASENGIACEPSSNGILTHSRDGREDPVNSLEREEAIRSSLDISLHGGVNGLIGNQAEPSNPLAINGGSQAVAGGRRSLDRLVGSAPPRVVQELARSVSNTTAEARQLMQRMSSRLTGLLSGYRSVSLHSDDVDRHEFVLEMMPGHDVDHGSSHEAAWAERQSLVPNSPFASSRQVRNERAADSNSCVNAEDNVHEVTGGAANVDAKVTVFHAHDAHQRHPSQASRDSDEARSPTISSTHASSQCVESAPLLNGASLKTEAALQQSESCSSPNAEEQQSMPWYRSKKLLLVMGAYGAVSFLWNFVEELTPMFASTPYKQGGLNFTPDEMALPVSFAGAALVFFALVLYPRIQRRLGCLDCAKIGLTLAVPVVMLISTPSLVVPRYLAMQGMLIPLMGCKAICSIMCMTSSMILVNITAPIEQIGPVNGAGNMLASGMRALGPALSGQLWALCLSTGIAGNQFMAFGVVAAAFVWTRIIYGCIRL